jgi:aminoglycoside phosphotransferase (APT) family kinase protein
VLDWVDAALGDPAADVCRSSVLIRSVSAELAEAYVEAYVAMTDMDRARIEAWLPIVAGARLAEGVPHEAEALLALAAAT